MAEEQHESALRTLAFHASQRFENRKITYNGPIRMSAVGDIVAAIHPKITWVGREEKTSVDLTYRLAALNELRNKVEWYVRRDIKHYVTSIRFGLRRNITLRELSTEVSMQGRLPTKIAAAVEVMLR